MAGHVPDAVGLQSGVCQSWTPDRPSSRRRGPRPRGTRQEMRRCLGVGSLPTSYDTGVGGARRPLLSDTACVRSVEAGLAHARERHGLVNAPQCVCSGPVTVVQNFLSSSSLFVSLCVESFNRSEGPPASVAPTARLQRVGEKVCVKSCSFLASKCGRSGRRDLLPRI